MKRMYLGWKSQLRNITRKIVKGIGIENADKRRKVWCLKVLIEKRIPEATISKKKNIPGNVPVPSHLKVSSIIHRRTPDTDTFVMNCWLIDNCRINDGIHGRKSRKEKASDKKNFEAIRPKNWAPSEIKIKTMINWENITKTIK